MNNIVYILIGTALFLSLILIFISKKPHKTTQTYNPTFTTSYMKNYQASITGPGVWGTSKPIEVGGQSSSNAGSQVSDTNQSSSQNTFSYSVTNEGQNQNSGSSSGSGFGF